MVFKVLARGVEIPAPVIFLLLFLAFLSITSQPAEFANSHRFTGTLLTSSYGGGIDDFFKNTS